MRGVRPGAVAGVLVMSSVAAADPGGWYPFGPAKWWLVSSLALAALAAHLKLGRAIALDRRVVAVGAALLIWLTIATILGRETWYAWLGTPERHLGLLAYVVFAICAVVGAGFDRRDRRVFRRWVVAATAWAGGYAVVELFVGQPIDTIADTSRLGGPYGSAAYLAAALCLLLPIASGVVLDRSERRPWRWAAAIAVVPGAIAFVGSGTRGAWLAMAVAVVVATIARRPSRAVVLGGLAVAAVAIGVVAPRLADVVDRPTPVDARVAEWDLAVTTTWHHPLVGVGPEGYRTVVGAAIDADYERTYGREVLPDRAHSGPLDAAVVGGVPAGLLYLALMAMLALAAWRRVSGRSSPAEVGIAVGVLAYVVQQLVLFPLAEIEPVFWLAAGSLAAVPSRGRLPDWARIASTSVVAAAAALSFVSGLADVAADRIAADAVERASAERAQHAIDLRPHVIRYHLLRAGLEEASGTLAGVDAAIDATADALAVSPHDPIARQARAEALLERARITGDDADGERALAAWGDLVADSPYCLECEMGLGSAAANVGDADLARRAWMAAEELSPPGDERAADALAQLDAAQPAE